MSVAITAQIPVESFATSASAGGSPQAGQGAGGPSEKGLVDFFAKARVDAGTSLAQVADATNSAASSGAMIGKLREFMDKAHQTDAKNLVTRNKQRAAAAEAKTDIASLDTLGSLGKFSSLSQFHPVGQSDSISQFGSFNGFGSGSLPPGPASASLGPGPDLPGVGGQGRLSAMAAKMTDDLMDNAIHHMWTQVVVHGTTSVTKSVMTLLKGQ